MFYNAHRPHQALGNQTLYAVHASRCAAVAHADESGMRVAKKLHWLHVLATDTLMWMGYHHKRGGQAFESLALLKQLKGVLVYDGSMP